MISKLLEVLNGMSASSLLFLESSAHANRDLYIRSLIRLYKDDAKDTLSFFQIAGMMSCA